MLRQFFVHFSLALLFAFTQMGIATHEISHFSDLTQQSNLTQQSSQSNTSQPHQQDKNSANHQCEQCIAHAGIADNLPSGQFIFTQTQADFVVTVAQTPHFPRTTDSHYSARAPPQTT